MANHSNPIPSYISKQYMADLLKSHLHSQVIVNNIKFSPGSSVGDNYACQIWRIQIELSVDGLNKEMSLIAKVTPNTKTLESVAELINVFDNESAFFAKIMPVMKEKSKNHLDFAPECYHVDYEEKAIFMEDLKASGYLLQPRHSFLNRDQCALVVQALATFHGASLHVTNSDPELKNKYLSSFWNGEQSEMLQKFTRNAQLALERNIHKYGLSEKMTKKLLDYENRILGDEIKVLRTSENKLNFLLHGDCWKSNVMFKFEDEKATSVKLLDYQIVYYNSFANDLLYFLFSSVDAQVVVSNIDWLLEIYYNQLKNTAPDLENLTLERIKQEFNERLYFGFTLSIFFRAFILSESPPDTDKVVQGEYDVMGFASDTFIADLKIFLPFFEEKSLL